MRGGASAVRTRLDAIEGSPRRVERAATTSSGGAGLSLGVADHVRPFQHDDASCHECLELGQDAVDVLLRVHDLDHQRKPKGCHLDVDGMDVTVVAEACDTLEHRCPGHPFLAQYFDEPPEEGSMLVRP